MGCIPKYRTPADYTRSAYVRWRALPESERSPKTLEKFMEMYSVDAAFIAATENEEDFPRNVARAAAEFWGLRWPEVLQSMFMRSIDRTLPTKEQILWIEWFGLAVRVPNVKQGMFGS
jgi:hypothetical protein